MCLAAATGTVSPPIFRLRSAHPQKRQIKTYRPVFRVMCGRPQAFYRDLRSATIVVYGGQRIKFLFIIANVNFSKIVAFKGTIRKFLNTAAVHIEGLRHPPMCLFDTLFLCKCPFNGKFKVHYNVTDGKNLIAQGFKECLTIRNSSEI
jgi:hypothetical protein